MWLVLVCGITQLWIELTTLDCFDGVMTISQLGFYLVHSVSSGDVVICGIRLLIPYVCYFWIVVLTIV